MANETLKNKKIIISAGASGIGLATVKVCLDRGATVFVSDINEKYINKLKKNSKINKKLFVFNCDASDEYQVNELFEKIKKKTSKIDCLINNVGIAGPTATLENISTDDWENTMRVNVFSHYYFTRLAIPMLKKNKGGSIINISSGAGIMGFPLRSPYAASKWAIVGMTKTLSMELGKFKIRVNALCPGTIKGDRMIRVAKDKAKLLKISKKSIEKQFISMASMNCWIYESDIGKMCGFLISDDAARVSGQVIGVDGDAIRLH